MQTLKTDTLQRMRSAVNCLGWGGTHPDPVPMESHLFFYVVLLSQQGRVGEESPMTLSQLTAELTHPFLLLLHIGKITHVDIASGVWVSKATSVTGHRHQLMQRRPCRTNLRTTMPNTPPWEITEGKRTYYGYTLDTVLHQFCYHANLRSRAQKVVGQVCDILGLSPNECPRLPVL